MAAITLPLTIDIVNRRILASVVGSSSLQPFTNGDNVNLALRFVQNGQDYDASAQTVWAGIGVIGGQPTEGAFSVNYQTVASAALSFNASAAQVATALNAISTIISAGGVTVVSPAAGIYDVTFSTVGARDLMTGSSGTLLPSTAVEVVQLQAGTVSVAEIQRIQLIVNPYTQQNAFTPQTVPFVDVDLIQAGSSISSAVQLITVDPLAYGGSFALAFQTASVATTTALAFNALALDVQNALVALPNVGAGNISVSGVQGGPYTAVFGGTLANATQNLLTGIAGGLTVPLTMTGLLILRTKGIYELVGNRASASATFSVKLVDGDGNSETVLTVPSTINNTIFTSYPNATSPSDVFLTESESDARYAMKAPTDGSYQFGTVSGQVVLKFYDIGTSSYRLLYLNNGAVVVV